MSGVKEKYQKADGIYSDEAGLLTDFEDRLYRTENENSAQTWVSGAKTYAEWLGEVRGKHITEATLSDFDQYFSFVSDDFAPNTQSGKWHGVQRLYRWLELVEEIEHNPVAGLEREEWNIGKGGTITAGSDGYTAIEREEVEKLWEHAPAPRNRNQLIIKLLWFTGVRAEELCKIRIEDPPGADDTWFDREEGRIIIKNAKKVSDRQSDTRNVWYPVDRLKWHLQEWLDNGGRERLSPYAEDSPYLFLTHQAEQMRPSHVSRIVKEAGWNAGINEVEATDRNGNERWKIRAHVLRHSMATYHANTLGTPIHLLKEILGHVKLETTLRYVDDDEEEKQIAMQEPWE